MTRPVLHTGDVFRMQRHGGITRYYVETIRRLERPAEVIVGLHQSEALGPLGARAKDAIRVPAFPGSARLAAPWNAALDRGRLGRPGVILHPTYYRDPAGLPRTGPLVVTLHDMIHERFPALARRRWWSRPDPARHKAALCARADLVLVYSRSARADAVAMLGLPSGRLRVVPLAGRDWMGVTPVPVPGLAGPFVLWVGERHEYKNWPRALEAWATCPASRGTALLCVGGGPLRAAERERVAALGAGGRVRQRTAADGELLWAYDHAAFLLYPSLCEGFGLPILEAMERGCPVVTSGWGAPLEVGGDAAIAPADPEDAESLRQAIGRALAEGRSAARVAAGRARAAGFTWDASTAAVEAAYRELD